MSVPVYLAQSLYYVLHLDRKAIGNLSLDAITRWSLSPSLCASRGSTN